MWQQKLKVIYRKFSFLQVFLSVRYSQKIKK